MFCPCCGSEERGSNQYCRACGTNLRPVRSALERPDNITQSAVSAREEIGRAIAAKIMETSSVKELAKVTEDVLPEIEKFLESPEEKRMRRVRTGTIIASIGAGVAIAFSIIAALLFKDDFVMLAGMGLVCYFIGLSFVINGLLFTVPKKILADKSSDAQSQRELDVAELPTNELALPEPSSLFSSVTENTTRHLTEKQPVSRR